MTKIPFVGGLSRVAPNSDFQVLPKVVAYIIPLVSYVFLLGQLDLSRCNAKHRDH